MSVELLFVVVLALAQLGEGVEFQIRNNLPGPIWVGIGGNPPLNNGGFVLNPWQQVSVYSPQSWSGRFWARTWCNPNTRQCQTGSCGDRVECNGAGGEPPATLLEITTNGHQGLDFYDISLVDGFNVVASMQPLGGQGDCKRLACSYNLNDQCPGELRKIGGNGQDTVACYSACSKYHTDQYCCAGAYGTPQTCKPDQWQVNSARYFKQHCPDAYSYAYDDATSTFTCKAPAYFIQFG